MPAIEDPDICLSPDDRGAEYIHRVWGNWGEYMLIPRWRQWALQQLGVDQLTIGVDLFATPWTTVAPKFISKEMDSFSFHWPSLVESDNHLLWANTPFAALAKVAAKLISEPCRVALVTPQKEDQAWWKALLTLPHHKVILPPRHHLFWGFQENQPAPSRVEDGCMVDRFAVCGRGEFIQY